MNMTAQTCLLPCTAISVRKMPNIAALSFALLLALPSFAQAASGHILFVHGDVRIVNASGQERGVKKGEELQEGDTVITGKTGAAQVRMVDGGFLAVRPNTQLKVDTFRYAGKTDGSEKGIFTLTKGTFRAITGAVGKVNKENYEVRTPGATIGIRGTDHEPMFIPMPLPGEIAIGTPGTYDKVNTGEALIKTSAGTAFVGANQAGFAAGLNDVPVKLPSIPNFYKPAPPAQTSSTADTAQTGTTSTTTTDSSSGTSTTSDSTTASTGTTTGTTDTSGTTSTSLTSTSTSTSTTLSTTSAPVIQTVTTSSSTGSVSLSTLGTTTYPAPQWSGGVGADMWINSSTNMKETGSGAITIDGTSGKDIQLGASKEVISISDVDPNGGSFLFNSGTATLNGASSQQITDPFSNPLVTINWGRWDGSFSVVDHGMIKNSIGSFHYIYSPQVTTPTQLQSVTVAHTYNYIPGIGAVTDQNGQLGNITSVFASVDFANPSFSNAVSVSLNASTPGLTWSASGSMSLNTFLGGGTTPGTGTTLIGTCTGGACSGLANSAKGNINGLFVGAAAQGAITSFSLSGVDSSNNVVGLMNGVTALKCASGC